jgi:hypothetical protein
MVDGEVFSRLWDDGVSTKEICRQLGISEATVRRTRDRIGLEKRPLGGVQKRARKDYPHTVDSAYLKESFNRVNKQNGI